MIYSHKSTLNHEGSVSNKKNEFLRNTGNLASTRKRFIFWEHAPHLHDFSLLITLELLSDGPEQPVHPAICSGSERTTWDLMWSKILTLCDTNNSNV